MATLTPTQLVAAATEFLHDGGYTSVVDQVPDSGNFRVFEDPYGIVAVHVYDTWGDLKRGWPDAQAGLVELMSTHLTRPEPKAWEGYLVVMCPTPVAAEDADTLTAIRYDTNRVRKLVATGDELETVQDVRSALLPLLPLDVEPPSGMKVGLLDRLPDLLAEYGIEQPITRVVVEASQANASILERLHEFRSGT